MTDYDAREVLSAAGWSTREMSEWSEEQLEAFAREELGLDNNNNTEGI